MNKTESASLPIMMGTNSWKSNQLINVVTKNLRFCDLNQCYMLLNWTGKFFKWKARENVAMRETLKLFCHLKKAKG